MKVLVTGAKGQLGSDVLKRLAKNKIKALGTDIDSLDITDKAAVDSYIKSFDPDAVIHCAAWTAVDKAQEHPEKCRQINVLGTSYIAGACKEAGAKMIYISTDYVFNGKGVKPFQTHDKPDPVNYYGLTKYQGEQEVIKYLSDYFIIRISWVFGLNGPNFVKTMLNLAQTKNTLSVISDQIGSPTSTYDLAKLISNMVTTNKFGIYHATNEGFTSWYDFACAIFKQAGIKININPVPSSHFPTIAKRPLNSRLSKESLDNAGFNRLPSWQNALARYIDNPKIS
jgi:dTDP-4-dehydrorhamnose reductase